MYCNYLSPIGNISMASDGERLTCLSIEGQGSIADDDLIEINDLLLFRNVKLWLDEYFSGCVPDIEIPLDVRVSQFRREVYEILLAIPYGQTTTYGEIAKTIAKRRGIARMSAQAVGGAVGHNPISIIIPCHRVIGSDGSLTGYGGGIDLKVKLLTIEGVALPVKTL